MVQIVRKTAGTFVAGILGALTLSSVLLQPARADRPDGWKVHVYHQPVAPKQRIYSFTVEVRDAAGKPVEDAAVQLRVPWRRGRETRLFPAKHDGKGRYWRTVHLPYEGSQRYVKAVVEPAGAIR